MNVEVGIRNTISRYASALPDEILERARKVAEHAFVLAGEFDHDGAYPADGIRRLHELGLLSAMLPTREGVARIDPLTLSRVLRQIGYGSLPLGRLFEGHVNAMHLIDIYGDVAQIRFFSNEAASGKLFGVWNTDDSEGLHLISKNGLLTLRGRKNSCLRRRLHRTSHGHRY